MIRQNTTKADTISTGSIRAFEYLEIALVEKGNVRHYNSEPDSESSAPVLKNILKKRDEQDNFNEMS